MGEGQALFAEQLLLTAFPEGQSTDRQGRKTDGTKLVRGRSQLSRIRPRRMSAAV